MVLRKKQLVAMKQRVRLLRGKKEETRRGGRRSEGIKQRKEGMKVEALRAVEEQMVPVMSL